MGAEAALNGPQLADSRKDRPNGMSKHALLYINFYIIHMYLLTTHTPKLLKYPNTAIQRLQTSTHV